jgi:uncharacterized membrane protein YhiD involved in acid resistance
VSGEWDLLWRLAVALALSSAIGLEREMRQKSAGLRTYSLVGLGSALFVLVSTYGFSDASTRITSSSTPHASRPRSSPGSGSSAAA